MIQTPKGVFCNVCMARICMERHVFASPPSSIVEFLAPVAVCFSLANTTMEYTTRCQRLSRHRAVRGDNATTRGIVQHRVVIRDGNPPFEALTVTTIDTLLTDDDRCGLKKTKAKTATGTKYKDKTRQVRGQPLMRANMARIIMIRREDKTRLDKTRQEEQHITRRMG